MKPKGKSITTLAVTQAKAKSYEYDIPEEYHIDISGYNLYQLLYLTIGILGDISTGQNIDDEVGGGLLFSAQYFDSLIVAKPNDSLSDYYRLLGACAYYLNGLPGSAVVLTKNINIETLDLDVNGLDIILLSLLKKKKISDLPFCNETYSALLMEYISSLNRYYDEGDNKENLILVVDKLKDIFYEYGTDRELLLSDLIKSITNKFVSISLWNTLPNFSSLDISLWSSYIKQNSKIKELWPSQIKLGEEDIFKGRSGVIQMPTSAGKTKSMELLIRSSIIGRGVSLVVLIAPFRALCQEIYFSMKNEFKDMEDVKISLSSDVIQDDLDFEIDFMGEKNILILTPEKFLFINRNFPEIFNRIGLIIFDEGHLFDDPTRGAQYELLLSAIKMRLQPTSQVIFISAVIPNAKEISNWLVDDDSRAISVDNYNPTNRNIAFVSWQDQLGRLYFVDSNNIDNPRFFVPRLLESKELKIKPGERIQRHFPEYKKDKYDSQDIALLLGCKLVNKGSVAIFSGRKNSVGKMIERVVDVFERELDCANPVEYSNENEIRRFRNYFNIIYGDNSRYLKASQLGIFAHHADVPKGTRLAIEYAMQNELIKYIICTSTLAQGVNMPIKNLIISSHSQSGEIIKTRDFHNLIGRVGRAGFYTEGTVIFSDHTIYDRRSYYKTKWRWEDVKKILDPSKSEACRSFMYYLFEEEPSDETEKIKWQYNRNNIENAIKDYLLYFLSDDYNVEILDDQIDQLVKYTFAYTSFEDEQKQQLKDYFKKLAIDIYEEEPDGEKRKIYAKSSLPINLSKDLYNFIENKIAEINDCENPVSLLNLFWETIFSKGDLQGKIGDSDIALQFCTQWVQGTSYVDLLNFLKEKEVRIWGLNVDTVVNISENSIGYNLVLIISGITEILKSMNDVLNETVIVNFKLLQKLLKYGLSDEVSIIIYELGFTDRALAIKIKDLINNISPFPNKADIMLGINERQEIIRPHLNENYPSYFVDVLNGVIFE